MNRNRNIINRKKILEEEMKKNLLRRKTQIKSKKNLQERKKNDFNV